MSARITSTIESRHCRRAVFLVRPACLVCSGCSASSCRWRRSCLSEASFSSISCVTFWNVCQPFFSQSELNFSMSCWQILIFQWWWWRHRYDHGSALISCLCLGSVSSCMLVCSWHQDLLYGFPCFQFSVFQSWNKKVLFSASALISIAECPKTCLEPVSKLLTWMFWPASRLDHHKYENIQIIRVLRQTFWSVFTDYSLHSSGIWLAPFIQQVSLWLQETQFLIVWHHFLFASSVNWLLLM